MKCAKDASHLGFRLKKCTGCATHGVEFPYCVSAGNDALPNSERAD